MYSLLIRFGDYGFTIFGVEGVGVASSDFRSLGGWGFRRFRLGIPWEVLMFKMRVHVTSWSTNGNLCSVTSNSPLRLQHRVSETLGALLSASGCKG